MLPLHSGLNKRPAARMLMALLLTTSAPPGQVNVCMCIYICRASPGNVNPCTQQQLVAARLDYAAARSTDARSGISSKRWNYFIVFFSCSPADARLGGSSHTLAPCDWAAAATRWLRAISIFGEHEEGPERHGVSSALPELCDGGVVERCGCELDERQLLGHHVNHLHHMRMTITRRGQKQQRQREAECIYGGNLTSCKTAASSKGEEVSRAASPMVNMSSITISMKGILHSVRKQRHATLATRSLTSLWRGA